MVGRGARRVARALPSARRAHPRAGTTGVGRAVARALPSCAVARARGRRAGRETLPARWAADHAAIQADRRAAAGFGAAVAVAAIGRTAALLALRAGITQFIARAVSCARAARRRNAFAQRTAVARDDRRRKSGATRRALHAARRAGRAHVGNARLASVAILVTHASARAAARGDHRAAHRAAGHRRARAATRLGSSGTGRPTARVGGTSGHDLLAAPGVAPGGEQDGTLGATLQKAECANGHRG